MKSKLQLTAAIIALSIGVYAQNGKTASKNIGVQNQSNTKKIIERGCGSIVPGEEWNTWFNQKVEEFKAANPNAKNQMVNYTIPVVVHIIHSGQAVGTGFNISQAQVIDQINILNADFAGTGLNSSSVPTAFAPLKANTQINFCLATKNPSGVLLLEPGIDRVNSSTMGWTTSNYTQSYTDGTIKPATIWDPTRYMNMWVLDLGSGLLGYATFPSGTGLTGLSGFGTATTDGVVMLNKAFGSIGTATTNAPYHKGRTTTHEVGHYLGLRHIWGDAGQCTATDYCNDTPPQKGGTASPAGCYYGCPTYPSQANTCTLGGLSNTNGDMFMNFMDYTDDLCMYMFTYDQTTRLQTAMSSGTYRNMLTTSAGTLCTLTAGPPTASFNIPTSGCTNTNIVINNLSNGNPVPTFVWSSNPSAGVTFNPNNTATNPTINFTTPGNYSITVVATNSLGSNSNIKTITVSTCSPAIISCNDTLTNFNNTDTLFRTGSSNGGYVGGNNGYLDLEKGEFYSSTGLAGSAQIFGGTVLFYRKANGTAGTTGSGNVVFKLYNATSSGGPTGAAINTFTASLSSIIASPTTSISVIGNTAINYGATIKAYSFNFLAPTTITGDFVLAVKLPTTVTAGDTASIFFSSENGRTASTAWELQSSGTWVPFNDGTATSWQLNASLAILPKIQCITTSINQNSILDKGISMYPNPTNGLISVIATLPSTQDIDITVNNVMGQVILKSKYISITNDVITLDMSKYNNGVYFITINNGQEKIVKRVILNK